MLLILPNNIIHPSPAKGLAFVSSCFGRVMMSVISRSPFQQRL